MICPTCGIGELYKTYNSNSATGIFRGNDVAHCNFCGAGIRIKED